MVEVRDSVKRRENLVAKKDALVIDQDGVTRKVMSGEVVPLDLREAYADETGQKFDLPYVDSGSSQKSDDADPDAEPGEPEELPGDDTKITPAGTAPAKKSAKK